MRTHCNVKDPRNVCKLIPVESRNLKYSVCFPENIKNKNKCRNLTESFFTIAQYLSSLCMSSACK